MAPIAVVAMGRVARWPGRRPESPAVGQDRSHKISLQVEESPVAVPEHPDDKRARFISSRMDRGSSAVDRDSVHSFYSYPFCHAFRGSYPYMLHLLYAPSLSNLLALDAVD